MAVTRKPVTAEELLRTPDDGLWRELVREEVRALTPAGNVHGRIAVNVTCSLASHVGSEDLGSAFAVETGFEFSSNPDTVRAPDVAFVRRERVEAVGEIEGFRPGPPDLAVEVVSPDDRFAEVEEKVAEWLAAGTRMVLVVTPRTRTVMVRTSEREARILSEGEVLDGGAIVPGWTLPVADVFR